MFRIQQFAQLGNVTVRTLRHYDRVGLLVPSQRTKAGYRLYTHADVGRLERILVLRYLGLSLREIADLLASRGGDEHDSLALTLQRQSRVLRERKASLDRVLRAVDHALEQADSGWKTPEWILYQSILKEINMSEAQQWMDKYYSPQGQQALQVRRQDWTPELQAEISAKWQALYADVQQAIDTQLKPESSEARILAERWLTLADAFTQGKSVLREGVRNLFADRQNWPQNEATDEMRRLGPKPEYTSWLGEVMRAHKMTWS